MLALQNMHCLTNVFPSSFYILFKAPNANELNSFIDSDTKEETDYDWSRSCKVRTFGLDARKYIPLLQPSFKIFGDHFSKPFRINIEDPWLNYYERGSFQEMHDHQTEFACVYFINSGPDFSVFSFYDRNRVNLLPECQYIMDYKYQDTPNISAGDIIFFPGQMLHYVSPHNSDTIRKTLSVNLKIQHV